MTVPTPDALASALPAGMSKRTGNGDVFWDTARVAQFQADRLAEAGYVLVHTAPEVDTVERLARAIHDHACLSDPDVGCEWFQDGLGPCRPTEFTGFANAVLAALAGTSAQARSLGDTSRVHKSGAAS